MTNEDAIKWLDNLKNDIGNPHYEGLWHYAQAIDEIIALLEERKPKPVSPVLKRSYYRCGACGEGIVGIERDGFGLAYCSACGRAVLWK